MLKKSIIDFSRYMPASLKEKLSQHYNVISIKEFDEKGKALFLEAVHEAHGLLGAAVRMDAALLSEAKKLEVISSISVGYDNYDLAYLNQQGILLTNTPDVLTETTADLGFTLLMAAARRLIEAERYIQQGAWQKTIGEALFASDIHGKTLGIIGFGRIGQAIAKRGYAGFGMKILYHSRHEYPEAAAAVQAQFCSLADLLSKSDFIVITIPLSEQTYHMIDVREFNQMSSEAILINISRGQIINESALIDALQDKKIKSAGLDVFEHEPLPMNSPLLLLPNVVLSPHIGSATFETRSAMAELAVQNLMIALEGKRPPNLVNEAALLNWRTTSF